MSERDDDLLFVAFAERERELRRLLTVLHDALALLEDPTPTMTVAEMATAIQRLNDALGGIIAKMSD